MIPDYIRGLAGAMDNGNVLATKIYHGRKDFLIVGTFLVVLGLAVMSYLLYRAFDNVPTYVSSGRGLPSHLATKGEMIRDSTLCLMFPAVGIAFLVFQRLASVTLNADGVILRGGIGQEKFRLSYGQIDSVGDVRQGNRMRIFSVVSGGKEYMISDVYAGFDEIRDELMRRTAMFAVNNL